MERQGSWLRRLDNFSSKTGRSRTPQCRRKWLRPCYAVSARLLRHHGRSLPALSRNFSLVRDHACFSRDGMAHVRCEERGLPRGDIRVARDEGFHRLCGDERAIAMASVCVVIATWVISRATLPPSLRGKAFRRGRVGGAASGPAQMGRRNSVEDRDRCLATMERHRPHSSAMVFRCGRPRGPASLNISGSLGFFGRSGQSARTASRQLCAELS